MNNGRQCVYSSRPESINACISAINPSADSYCLGMIWGVKSQLTLA